MRTKALLAILSIITFSGAAALGESKSDAITDDVLKLRDPFKRPQVLGKSGIPKSDLELFPLDQFKLIGVLTGPVKMKAMVVAPNGKTYFVSENQKIGTRDGIIRKITTQTVFVREKITNVIGREETIDFEIKLPSDRQQAVGPTTGG